MKERHPVPPGTGRRAPDAPLAGPRPIPPGVARHAVDPGWLGSLPHPEGYAHLRGDCGDALEVFLRVKAGRVVQARFDALGCEFTVACGNAAMQLAEGKPLDEALQIAPEAIAAAIEELPPDHFHCAELAVETLRKALRDSRLRSSDPAGAPPCTRTADGPPAAPGPGQPLTPPG